MPKISAHNIDALSSRVVLSYNELQKGKKPWNRLYGQELVYDFERSIGFCNAAGLCAAIETAHKTNYDIHTAAVNYFEKLEYNA